MCPLLCFFTSKRFKQQNLLFRILITMEINRSIQRFLKFFQKMQKLKKVIKMSDFFNSFQMLRYEQEAQYRTFTGGLISIAVIITIIIAFASMILDTVNRITINFSHRNERKAEPSLTTLETSEEGNFMFGVEVWGYNLSQQYRLFDVVLSQIHSTYGQNYTSTSLPLVPCTKEHWQMLPQVAQSYERLHMGNWLCPKIGSELRLQGRYSSQSYNQLSITLYPCSNDTDIDRPCGPIENLQNFFEEQGQWNYFTFYSINTIINADQPEYLKYYLEDRSFIVFSDKLGGEYDMYLKGVSIQTDNSIWPFQSLNQFSTYNMDFSPILYPFSVDNTTSFATFYIMKEPTEEFYVREVQKIFVVFSFMGGLIGAIMAALFIINAYTSFAFELALSIQVFKDEKKIKTHQVMKKTHESPWTLNIFQFLKYQLYSIAKKLKIKIDNPGYDYITECRSQIIEQLDIKNILKRLIFLQYSLSFLFEDYQLSELHKQKPCIPRDIKNLRRKIQFQGGIDDKQHTVSEQMDDCITENQKKQTQKAYEKSESNLPSRKKKEVEVPYHHAGEDTPQNFLEPPGNACLFDEIATKERMRKSNINKIMESASNGNIVSRRLLRLVKPNPQSEINAQKIETIECFP